MKVSAEPVSDSSVNVTAGLLKVSKIMELHIPNQTLLHASASVYG